MGTWAGTSQGSAGCTSAGPARSGTRSRGLVLGAVLGALVLVALVAVAAVTPVVAEALTGDAAAVVADPDVRRRLGLPVLLALVAVVGETACLLRVLAAEPLGEGEAPPPVVVVPRSAT